MFPKNGSNPLFELNLILEETTLYWQLLLQNTVNMKKSNEKKAIYLSSLSASEAEGISSSTEVPSSAGCVETLRFPFPE